MEHNISEKDLKEAVMKMEGRTPINPIGQCFESALFAYYYLRQAEIEGDVSEVTLIHAEGVANMPGQAGKPIVHAWVRFRNKTITELVAFEPTWGIYTTHAKILTDLQVKYVKEYTYEDIKHEITKDNNIDIGPWDQHILSLAEKKKSE